MKAVTSAHCFWLTVKMKKKKKTNRPTELKMVKKDFCAENEDRCLHTQTSARMNLIHRNDTLLPISWVGGWFIWCLNCSFILIFSPFVVKLQKKKNNSFHLLLCIKFINKIGAFSMQKCSSEKNISLSLWYLISYWINARWICSILKRFH